LVALFPVVSGGNRAVLAHGKLCVYIVSID